MRSGGVPAAILVIAGAWAVSACGSTKIVTVTNTVIKESTTTVTASATDTAPTDTASATTPATTTPAAPGTVPVLSGTYGLNETANPGDGNLPGGHHSGLIPGGGDQKWTFMNGSCTKTSCQVDLRRLLSDSTIEDLMMYSNSPAGVYTGTIPGGGGDATCVGNATAKVKLSMIVRVGGLESVGGQTVASRLAGHIFGDYQCPGSSPTHDVATYVGTLS